MSFKVVTCSFPECKQLIVFPENIPPTNVGHANIIVSVREDSKGINVVETTKKLEISDIEFRNLKNQIQETLNSQKNDEQESRSSKVLYCPNAHPNIIYFRTEDQ